MKKGISLIILVCFLLTSFIPPSYASEKSASNSSSKLYEYNQKENGYEAYLEKYKEKDEPDKEVYLEGGSFSSSQGDVEVSTSYEGKEGNLVKTSESGYVEWDFDIEDEGLYNIEITYFPLEGRRSAIEREIKIDGEIPFNEARVVTFQRMFASKSQLKQDNQGNDIRPSQVENPIWRTVLLKDAERLFKEPLKFYLDKGRHTLRLTGIKEPMIISSIRILNKEQLKPYKEVSNSYDLDMNVNESYMEIYQAENAYLKSDPTLYPLFDRSSSKTEPFAYDAIKLNIMGGINWKTSGQWMNWKVTVPKDGYYKLAFKYRQNFTVGIPVTRALYVDDEQQFKEMEQIEFYDDSDWKMKTIGDDKDPYLFYLTGGEHEIKLEVTMGPVSDIIRKTHQVTAELQSLYTRIVMLTGVNPDYYRDYQLEKKLPEMLPTLQDNLIILQDNISELKKISKRNVNAVNIVEQLAFQLEDMIKDPDTITKRLGKFRDNISGLSTWLLTVQEMPLDLDYLIVATPDEKLPSAKMSFIDSVVFHVRSFITSFTTDYNTLGNTYANEDTITVWSMMSRDQANTLKALIDEEFTPKTGINVNLSLINNDSIMLFSAASGSGPDVALNITRYLPMDFGIRNALVDLSTLEGFDEVKELFADSAFIPYSYGGKVYGIPMTESFPMLFCRTDIMNSLGLEVPETWDDLYKVIGLLQENNLQFAPGDLYSTLLLQSECDYYDKDLTKVLLDTKEGIEIFKQWTNLYTQYGLDVQYDFFNRFRTGEMPIGIADYTMYNQLAVAAPQIKGLWKMYPMPGTLKEDGTIDKTIAGNRTASVIFNTSNNVDQSWEFLQWWMSADIQAKFGKEIEAVLGTAARYNTATIDAVGYLDWPAQEYEAIMDQWSYLDEIPYIPGSYFISRHIGNAFNEVVVNGALPRETIEKYTVEINKEINKKLEELVYK